MKFTYKDFEKIFKNMKLISVWYEEHQLKDNEFFYHDGWVYCRKCNFPMIAMREIMFYRCENCNGCVSYCQVMKAPNLVKNKLK